MKKGLLLVAIAAIASLGAIFAPDWKRFAYDGFGRRDRWQYPERVIGAIALRQGDRVADLGAGGGYFTFRLADAVGPTGIVYAVDVDEEMLGEIAARAAAAGYANIVTVLAAADDPRLPAHGVDLIFASNSVHHIADRRDYFRRAARYLDSDGRVAIVDYTGEGYSPTAWLLRLSGHIAPPALVRGELVSAGYRLENEYDFLPRQGFLVFSVGPGALEVRP